MKESAKKNGVLGANLDTDRARGAERSSSGLMSISRSSGGLGYSTAEGCYTSSNRTAKCSGSALYTAYSSSSLHYGDSYSDKS